MIVPLTRRKKCGALYERPAPIEPLLIQLAALSRDELVERAAIRDRAHPEYVPSECVLYFVRASRRDNSDAWFERLYKILVERVLRSVPRAESGGNSTSLTSERIRNLVFDRFVEMLASDRRQADDKLDFFEVRFDLAIKRLRLDAQDLAWREESRTRPLDDEGDGALSADVEAAEVSSNPFDDDIFSDPIFRERLYSAIDSLPPEQSRTMHLLLLGWPTYSSDPEVMTIAKALQCSDRSIRNYRERAMKTLAALFNHGNDQ
ncbi:DNA-binding response regulator [Bosea thiooxidans]|nr:DNA-binding response regulator [Bosea sp. (in: a-proteobacteria)]